MRKLKLSISSQQRLDEILAKGTNALDDFYRRHGESDVDISKKSKLRHKINGHRDPGPRAMVSVHGKSI
jgi:hypothetical protein